MPQKKVLVGTIVSAKGLKGEVKIKTYTLDPLSLLGYDILDEHDNKIIISSSYLQKKSLIVKIKGVDTKKQADNIIGLNLYIAREHLPSLDDEDSFYYVDLIGLVVKNKNNDILGKIKNVSNYGAQDIIEILLDSNNKILMLPFIRNIVLEVNLKEGYLVISNINITT